MRIHILRDIRMHLPFPSHCPAALAFVLHNVPLASCCSCSHHSDCLHPSNPSDIVLSHYSTSRQQEEWSKDCCCMDPLCNNAKRSRQTRARNIHTSKQKKTIQINALAGTLRKKKKKKKGIHTSTTKCADGSMTDQTKVSERKDIQRQYNEHQK